MSETNTMQNVQNGLRVGYDGEDHGHVMLRLLRVKKNWSLVKINGTV
jgi:hypothetical protein